MAETQQERHYFSFHELLEMMIQRQNIREGKWVFNVEFGLGGLNVTQPDTEEHHPAAVVPILKIGMQRNDDSTLPFITVDASKVHGQK